MVEQIRESLDDFVTTDEASAILGRSQKTLSDYRWKGVGPAYVKVGVAILYRRTDVLEFKAQREAGAALRQAGGAQ